MDRSKAKEGKTSYQLYKERYFKATDAPTKFNAAYEFLEGARQFEYLEKSIDHFTIKPDGQVSRDLMDQKFVFVGKELYHRQEENEDNAYKKVDFSKKSLTELRNMKLTLRELLKPIFEVKKVMNDFERARWEMNHSDRKSTNFKNYLDKEDKYDIVHIPLSQKLKQVKLLSIYRSINETIMEKIKKEGKIEEKGYFLDFTTAYRFLKQKNDSRWIDNFIANHQNLTNIYERTDLGTMSLNEIYQVESALNKLLNPVFEVREKLHDMGEAKDRLNKPDNMYEYGLPEDKYDEFFLLMKKQLESIKLLFIYKQVTREIAALENIKSEIELIDITMSKINEAVETADDPQKKDNQVLDDPQEKDDQGSQVNLQEAIGTLLGSLLDRIGSTKEAIGKITVIEERDKLYDEIDEMEKRLKEQVKSL